MADDLSSLVSRIDLLEKVFKNHLGPNFGASSMNIPHPGVDTDLTALTARVVALETALTAAQTAITTSGRYL